MADLAQAVGMSRTALYPLFRNKGDVFDAVIRHATAKTIGAIRQDLDQHETLDAIQVRQRRARHLGQREMPAQSFGHGYLQG